MPRGLQTPMFQAAGQKGDGGGNGGGGMYFWQGEPEEADSFTSGISEDPPAESAPFAIPLFASIKEALTTWRIALANLLYQKK